MLYAFAREFGVPHKRCGKLLVAVNEGEVGKLAALKAQAEPDGATDLVWLNGRQAARARARARRGARAAVALDRDRLTPTPS